MNLLVEAFESFFRSAADSGTEVATTAKFTLDNVDWNRKQKLPDSMRHPIVDAHLESACVSSAKHGTSAHAIAGTLLEVSDQLHWRASSKASVDGPDIEIFLRNFAVTTVIGTDALLPSDKVSAGFSLQAPDVYYPPHAHRAEESYWIIGGDGDWKVDKRPWFPVIPGDSIYHKPHARHAMQTNERPLLTVWLWTSHLDSEVLIVRD